MEILHADRHIAVCIKPVGMDSEKDVPAALITQLGGEIFPIHRLDQNVAVLWSMPAPRLLQPLCPEPFRKAAW